MNSAVVSMLGLVQPEIPPGTDPVAMARPHRECAAPKEALSEDAEVTVPLLDNGYTNVTRAGFDRSKVRLCRAKFVIGSAVLLVAALAVIPSPFSADEAPPPQQSTQEPQPPESSTVAPPPAESSSTGP